MIRACNPGTEDMEVERPSVPGKPGQRELQHPFLKTKIKIK
jgi:hypothetical protein